MWGMKTIKPKSIFALILFSILTFGLASIATSAGTRITNNGFEDSFPKTAGGYVVWQGQDGTGKFSSTTPTMVPAPFRSPITPTLTSTPKPTASMLHG